MPPATRRDTTDGSLPHYRRRVSSGGALLSSDDDGCESFPFSSHASDLKIGTAVATMPGAWRYRVSVGTGRHNVSVL